MGKKNGGAGRKRVFKKDPVATKMATGVKKTKTKAVSNDVKRRQFQMRAQTEALNAQLRQMKQQQQTDTKKERMEEERAAAAAAAEAGRLITQSRTKTTKQQTATEEEEPDVDMAAEEFEKLTSIM